MSKSCMLVKIFTNIHISPTKTFFANIHINLNEQIFFRQHTISPTLFSPTSCYLGGECWWKFFINIHVFHQHENSPTSFTNIKTADEQCLKLCNVQILNWLFLKWQNLYLNKQSRLLHQSIRSSYF